MISSVLAVAMAASMQPTDTTRASREAFTACLRTYVTAANQNRTSAADFAAAYPQQCTAQQAAFRQAIIARERASRVSQANAEESADTEVEDARANLAEWYEPPQQTAAAPAPAAAPAATPAATPAPAPAAQPAAQQTPH